MSFTLVLWPTEAIFTLRIGMTFTYCAVEPEFYDPHVLRPPAVYDHFFWHRRFVVIKNVPSIIDHLSNATSDHFSVSQNKSDHFNSELSKYEKYIYKCPFCHYKQTRMRPCARTANYDWQPIIANFLFQERSETFMKKI